MTTQNDPAKRLYDILNTIISHGEESAENAPIVNVLRDALDITVADVPNLLSELILIINSCEIRIRQTQNINQALHLTPLTNVKNALFYTGISGNWGAFRRYLDDGTMLSLQFVSEALSKAIAEENIDAEDLKTLQEEVEALLEKVLETDLDEQLKTALVDGLEAIRQAILDYRIYGADGLRQAFDRNMGLIARYREDFQQASESEGKEVVFGYSNVLRKLDGLVSVGLKLKRLAEPIINRLMLGDGSS